MSADESNAAALAYPFIAARILNTPLMIESGKLDVILSVVAPRFGLTAEALTGAAVAPVSPFVDSGNLDRSRRQPLKIHAGVAVIDVLGTLVSETNGLQPFSGLTPYQGIAHDFESAVSDPKVKAILFRIDSPGGEATAVWDLADAIHKSPKPTASAVGNMAASAAYILAAATQKIFISQSANVGSIGVIARHVDRTGAEAKAGIKVTNIYRGARKADFSNPLNEESTKTITALVDSTYNLFADKVAAFRGITRAQVDSQESRIFHGAAAIEQGLADAVKNESEAFNWLSEFAASGAASIKATLTSEGDPMNPHSRILSLGSALLASAALAPEGGSGAAPAPAADPKAAPAPAADDPKAAPTPAPAAAVIPAAVVTSAAAFASASPEAAAVLRAEGATAERKRIGEIESLAVAGEGDLVARMKADGTTTADAGLMFAKTRKDAREKQSQLRTGELGRGTQTAASAEGRGDHPAETMTGAAVDQGEIALRAKWNGDADLRATYGDHEQGFKRFVAYSALPGRGSNARRRGK